MPGIMGLVDPSQNLEPDSLLHRMAKALEPSSSFLKDIYCEDGFGFGRVSLSSINSAPQPFWDSKKSLGVVLEGEMYSGGTLKDRGNPGSVHSPTTLEDQLLSLHQQSSLDRLSGVNGAFSAAFWEPADRTLTLVNDRLGLQPLYYARVGDGILFASGVRALLADPRLSRDIDHVAIAEFLTFDHILNQRTLLKSVSLLPQGSILTFRNGQLEVESYWKPTPQAMQSRVQPELAFESMAPLLRNAVDNQVASQASAGLLLSGGLDSRFLLAAMAESDLGQNFSTFTWGIPNCDDARYAKESAARVGVGNMFFELKPDWLKHHALDGVRVTDGMANVVNLHAMATLNQVSQQAEVLYKGFLGDAMFGFGLTRRYWAEYAPEDMLQVHLDAYRDYDVLTFDLPEHKQLFSSSFQQKVGDELLADYQNAIDQADSDQPALQRIFIDFTQRVPRMTLNGVLVARERSVVRLPFADSQLVDFSLELPPGLLFERQVMKEGFRRAYPQLAQIPIAPSGLPMMNCARDIVLRARNLLQWHLRQRGFGILAGPSSRPYKDYNLWFRSTLKGWVESVLLDGAFLERGYFHPEFVQRVIRNHMAGANNAVQLGAFISLELWHRMFIDNSEPLAEHGLEALKA